jgi:DNA polymerase-3 subunit beta
MTTKTTKVIFDVTVARAALLPLLERAEGIADKKSVLPILANVLLTPSDGQLKVAASDLYISITGRCDAEVAVSKASVALHAKELLERVKNVSDGPLRITVDDEMHATIKSVGTTRKFEMTAMQGKDFPELPTLKEATHSLSVSTLASLIEHTYYAICDDETREHINSAFFEWTGDRVRMVATDGHRLSKVDVPAKEHAPCTVLIQKKAVGHVLKLLEFARKEKAAEVGFAQDGRNMMFSTAGVALTARLVDATFPPYDQVIPSSKYGTTVRVLRSVLLNAVNAVQVAATEKEPHAHLHVQDGQLRIHSKSSERGEAEDVIPVDQDGQEATVASNWKYLRDVLSVLGTDDVVLHINEELSPVMVTPVGGPDFVGIVMPMRKT